MRSILFCLLVTLNYTSLPGQEVIKGKVTDAATGSPLPYVNIGIRKLATGTVSDERGNYQLKASAPNDTVTFSCLGYQSRNIRMADLIKDSGITMTAQSYDLQAVEVTPGMLTADEIILGTEIRKRKHSVGFGSSQLGTEIGALIRVRKKTLLKAAHFTLNHAKGDSMYFRVNIYDAARGNIGDNLLRQNVIIATSQQTGTITVDLSEFGIIADDDLLLALQWIRDDMGAGNMGITFRARQAGAPNLYTKIASIGEFQKVNEAFPGAPALQLSFFLSGKLME